MQRQPTTWTERRKDAMNSDPESKSVVFWQVYLKLPSPIANDATFPFVVVKFPSTTLMARGPSSYLFAWYHHLFSLCLQASSPSKPFAPEQIRGIVHVLACFPLFYPSCSTSNPPINHLFHLSQKSFYFQLSPRTSRVGYYLFI